MARSQLGKGFTPSGIEDSIADLSALNNEKIEKKDVERGELVASPPPKTQPPDKLKISQSSKKAAISSDKTRLHASFYITKDQYKALKMRAAISDRVEDKDLSTIVRTALGRYLQSRE